MFGKKKEPEEPSRPQPEQSIPASKPEAYRTSTPTMFLERLTEKERLSLQRARFDEYFEAEGWAGEKGGKIENMDSGFVRRHKPFVLAKKHLRDLIAKQQDEKDWSDVGDLWDKYSKIVAKAEKMGPIEGAAFLDLVASRLVGKSGLDIAHRYETERDVLKPPPKRKKDDGETGAWV